MVRKEQSGEARPGLIALLGHWLWTVRISRADVAAFMLDQVTDSRYVRASVGLAN